MKLITKIKNAERTKKDRLFIDADLNREETKKLVAEMVMSVPKGHYKLHGREYGTNLIDTVWKIYGWMPSMHIDEGMMLGLQACYPEKVYASFTLGLDAIEIK